MAVNITWSAAEDDPALTDPVDHGAAEAGQIVSTQDIFVRHDGTNQITDCGLYLAARSGYTGDSSAAADLNEILAWGDGGDANAFGGLFLLMDAPSFPTDPTFSVKSGTAYNTFRSGFGSEAGNKILLAEEMGDAITSSGVMIASDGDARLNLKIKIPADETVAGIRQFDLKLRYTFTS